MNLQRMGQEAVDITRAGRYVVGGRTVYLGPTSDGQTVFPDDPVFNHKPKASFDTEIEVTKEPTLRALRRLGEEGSLPLALNFASAHSPGGGFLRGAQAQEESLARSSTLYSTLLGQPYYGFHERNGGIYSDAMVYSRVVQIFRGDRGELLEQPHVAAFITSPAVNVSAGVRDPGLVQSVMQERTRKVLALASHHGHTKLVLGAWGCGVFGNDPTNIARIFKAQLQGPFKGAFEKVVFAIYGGHSLGAFQRTFA